MPDLWRRGGADLVIALEVDLVTIRSRRGEDWPADLLTTQRERLALAYATATLRIDTGTHPAGATVETALAAIRRWRDAKGSDERLSSA